MTDDVICGVKRKGLKAVLKIQKKIMRARSTLDWSQSKIFLVTHILLVQFSLCTAEADIGRSGKWPVIL